MIFVKKEEIFNTTIDDIWQHITDLDMQNWRSDIERVEIVDKKRFIEYDRDHQKVEFVIVNKVKNEIYEFNLMNENLEGHCLSKLKVLDDGRIHLEMSEAIELKKKSMKLFAKKYLEKKQKQYFIDLKKALEK